MYGIVTGLAERGQIRGIVAATFRDRDYVVSVQLRVSLTTAANAAVGAGVVVSAVDSTAARIPIRGIVRHGHNSLLLINTHTRTSIEYIVKCGMASTGRSLPPPCNYELFWII